MSKVITAILSITGAILVVLVILFSLVYAGLIDVPGTDEKDTQLVKMERYYNDKYDVNAAVVSRSETYLPWISGEPIEKFEMSDGHHVIYSEAEDLFMDDAQAREISQALYDNVMLPQYEKLAGETGLTCLYDQMYLDVIDGSAIGNAKTAQKISFGGWFTEKFDGDLEKFIENEPIRVHAHFEYKPDEAFMKRVREYSVPAGAPIEEIDAAYKSLTSDEFSLSYEDYIDSYLGLGELVHKLNASSSGRTVENDFMISVIAPVDINGNEFAHALYSVDFYGGQMRMYSGVHVTSNKNVEKADNERRWDLSTMEEIS